MRIIRRQPGERRWEFPAEFPLVDCDGVLVEQDRRELPDRRKTRISLEDLLELISEMPLKSPDRKQ